MNKREKLETFLGSVRFNKIIGCCAILTFLAGMSRYLLGGEVGFWNAFATGASLPMALIEWVWVIEAKIKRDNAELAANDAEIARLEAQIEQAKKNLDVELQKILEENDK